MSELFPCPNCGAQFGDEKWRDDHLAVCRLFKRDPEEKKPEPPAPTPVATKSSRLNFVYAPIGVARILERFLPEAEAAARAMAQTNGGRIGRA